MDGIIDDTSDINDDASDSDSCDWNDPKLLEQSRFGFNDSIHISSARTGSKDTYEVQHSLRSHEGHVDAYLLNMGKPECQATEQTWLIEIWTSARNTVGDFNLRIKVTLCVGRSAGLVISDETQVIEHKQELAFFQLKKRREWYNEEGQKRIESIVFTDCALTVVRSSNVLNNFDKFGTQYLQIAPVFRGAKVFGVECRKLNSIDGCPRSIIEAPLDPPTRQSSKKRVRPDTE